MRVGPGLRVAATLAMLVGPVVRAESPTADPEPPETDAGGEVVLGHPSSIRLEAPVEEVVRVEAGTPLYDSAGPQAAVLLVIDAVADLPVLERRPGWTRVRYEAWKGWISTGGREVAPAAPPGVEPPPLTAPEPAPPQPPTFVDLDRLERLRTMLGEAGTVARKLGPYALYTDVDDPELLARFDRIAARLPEAYEHRFGLDPGTAAGEAVLLLAREETYRAYESEDPEIAGSETRGHTSGGISITFVGDQTATKAGQVLVHEMTHLLNRRTLGDNLVPWLEEGMAEDLAMSQVDDAGRPLVGTLNGEVRFEGSRSAGLRGSSFDRVEITGGHASLATLLEHWRRPGWTPLVSFLDLPTEDFMRRDSREIHYAEAAFLVRYLLDGDDARSADAFRGFLARVAAGESGSGDGLAAALGVQTVALERDFHAWLLRQANAQGVPVLPR